MKLPFFGTKKSPEDKAREQALKQEKKDEKARLAELKKQHKAHDALARQAAKDEKKRAKRQASEWKKQEKLLREREQQEQKRIEAREKQERKRVKKLERQHATARRREARRARKQLMCRRRKAKKLRKLQKKQRRAQDPSVHQREIDELLAATALEQSPIPSSQSRAASPPSSAVVAVAPEFKKRAHCGTCRGRFRLGRVRHHCRNCGESCCRQCLSATRRPIPWHGKPKPQKICVACDTLVFSDRTVASATAVPETVAAAVVAPSQAHSAEIALPPVSAASSHASSRPASGSGISVSLSSRSARRLRRNNSGSAVSSSSSTASAPSKSKKPSLWTLPIRPLLKRKRSVEQLRNRQLDFELQLEKAAQLSRQGQRSLAIELQPQHTMLAAPLARAS